MDGSLSQPSAEFKAVELSDTSTMPKSNLQRPPLCRIPRIVCSDIEMDGEDLRLNTSKILENPSTPPAERVRFHVGEDVGGASEDEEREQHHDVFCELAELDVSNGPEWKETARWIKFEEDVEEGGERWSKPHVATLSLNSLFELRCCLQNSACIVLLNVDALTIEQIAAFVVEEYTQLDLTVSHELRERVRETIIQRHSHLYLRKKESGVLLRSLAEIGKKLSVSTRDVEKEEDESAYGIGALLHPAGPGLLPIGMGNLGAFALGVSGVLPPTGTGLTIPTPVGHGDQHPPVGRTVSVGSAATNSIRPRTDTIQRAASARDNTSALPPLRASHLQPAGHKPPSEISPNNALPFAVRAGIHGNSGRTPDELSPDSSKRGLGLSGGSSSNLRRASAADQHRSRSESHESVNSSGNQSSSVNRSQTSIARDYRDLLRKNSTQISFEDDQINSAVKFDAHFMKKIPPGAEAANILVGEVEWLDKIFVAFVRLNKAVLLGDLTEVPVPTRFIFILLGPTGNSQQYHEMGRSMATLMSDEIFHETAYKARSREDLLKGLDEFLNHVTVLPPGEWDPSIRIEPPENLSNENRANRKSISAAATKQPTSADPAPANGPAIVKTDSEERKIAKPQGCSEDDLSDLPLARTGRLFGGLINDVKRRKPWYWSDFRDALHFQCVAASVFLYFASLAPTITFGGMLHSQLDGHMATFESIVSAALCGIIYPLTAGQPLTILGSTGPVLIFETTLYGFSQNMGIDYMTFRLWVGLWTSLILILIVAFDLSSVVCYITRFTEEGFSCLVALIFIVEAFAKLLKIASENPIVSNAGVLYALGNRTLRCGCMLNASRTNESCANVTDLQRRYYITRSPETISSCSGHGNGNLTTVLTPSECKDLDGVLVGPDCDVPDYLPEVFFFSCILFAGTFIISYGLKEFKSSSYLSSLAREMISDFAVVIAIVLMSILDSAVGLATPKLIVPSSFKPTRNDRGWLIPLVTDKTPAWSVFAAVVPGALAAILLFMDQQISAVIVNRKENKLQKGVGYHLDLFIVTVLVAASSFLGIPWFVASTVPSINHVMALRKESKCNAPGEKPKYLGCRENRVTGLAIGVLTVFSVFLSGVLERIPMSVLYGVFLFMGISSLSDVELVTRISIVFQPQKLQPDLPWLRNVPLRRIHLFTVIQLVALATLWTIKAMKATSLTFPLLVGALVLLRLSLNKIFTQHELKYLDDLIDIESKNKSSKTKQRIRSDISMEPMKHGEKEKLFILDDGKVLSVKIEEAVTKDSLKFEIGETYHDNPLWTDELRDANGSLPSSPKCALQIASKTEPDSPTSSKRSSISEERKRFLDSTAISVNSDVEENLWKRHKQKLKQTRLMKDAETSSNGQLIPLLAAPNIVIYPSSPDGTSEI